MLSIITFFYGGDKMVEIFKFIDVDCSPSCIDQGYEIIDEDTLAQYVAWLLVGQSRHLIKIIEQLGNVAKTVNLETVHKATIISNLTLDEKSPKNERYKRDGWIFQMISWLVVYFKLRDKKFKMAHPHDQPSMHGIDGLAIVVEDGHIKNIIVTEDKCTGNPRTKITSEVFPEFIDFEQGKKDTSLLNNVGTLLELLGDDYDDAHNEITNKEIRQYRIGITRKERHNDDDGRKKLFAKYEDVVNGDIERRTASSTYIAELRNWMDSFSEKIIQKINLM